MSTTNQNIDGFSTALSGLNAQQSKLEMIGNNIANINKIPRIINIQKTICDSVNIKTTIPITPKINNLTISSKKTKPD